MLGTWKDHQGLEARRGLPRPESEQRWQRGAGGFWCFLPPGISRAARLAHPTTGPGSAQEGGFPSQTLSSPCKNGVLGFRPDIQQIPQRGFLRRSMGLTRRGNGGSVREPGVAREPGGHRAGTGIRAPGLHSSRNPRGGLHRAHLAASSPGRPGCHMAGLGPSWALGSADQAQPWETAHIRKKQEEGTGRRKQTPCRGTDRPRPHTRRAFTLLVWEMGTNSHHTGHPWRHAQPSSHRAPCPRDPHNRTLTCPHKPRCPGRSLCARPPVPVCRWGRLPGPWSQARPYHGPQGKCCECPGLAVRTRLRKGQSSPGSRWEGLKPSLLES